MTTRSRNLAKKTCKDNTIRKGKHNLITRVINLIKPGGLVGSITKIINLNKLVGLGGETCWSNEK
jgi:hypothetical protein